MSATQGIVAFKPADEKWKAMKKVWDSCQAAGIDSPKEVGQFFNHEDPDENGVKIDRKQLMECGAVRKWSAEMQEGFEIDVSKLPKDVTIVRCYTSY